MMCKTGCGRKGSNTLCGPCMELWVKSAEAARCDAMVALEEVAPGAYDRRADVAFVDFCTRIRAERLNGGWK